MALTAQWRNALAALLVFAVSPLSMCAQAVCNINCSFHEGNVPNPGLHPPKGDEGQIHSANRSKAIHCHELGNSVRTHPCAFRSRDGSCHGDSCVSLEGAAAASVVARGN